MHKWRLKPVEDEAQWDAWIDLSPLGTIFHKSAFLKNALVPYRLYYVLKGLEIVAGISLTLDAKEENCVLDFFVINSGLVFAPRQNTHTTSYRHDCFAIAEYVAEELTKKYKKIELALAPGYEDLRPFLWHKYHSDDPSEKFISRIMYTSILDVSSLATAKAKSENSTAFKGLSTLRKRNLREAWKAGAHVTESKDTDRLTRYYRTMLEEQGNPAPEERLERLKHLIDGLLREGQATLYAGHSSEGRINYMAVMCRDAKRGYYLYGAGDVEDTSRYKGTICFWEAFRQEAQNHAIEEIDLEGVNSPSRGQYKLSLGGNLKPYYHLLKHPDEGKS